MALPETTPISVPLPPKKEETPLKVTWLQEMLNKQNPVVKGEGQDVATPDKKLAFVAEKLDEILNKTEPKIEQVQTPDYSKTITWGLEGKPLDTSPVSGSILKLLMDEPGMKQKIESGIKNGHNYSLLHQPGQKNFFLWESWDETVDGKPTKKKRATPFLIKDPESIKPEAPVEKIITKTKEGEEDYTPVMVPLTSQSFMKVPMIPEDEGQVPEKKLDKVPEIKKEASVVNAPNNHWKLMRAKFSNDAFRQKSEVEQNRFQQKADQHAQPHFVDKIREYEQEQEALKPTFLEYALEGKMEGELLNQWNVIQNVPAHVFLYPDQYTWGTANEEKTLEDYPEAFKKLRTKILGGIEKLGLKGVDIKTIPLHEAIDDAVELGLIS